MNTLRALSVFSALYMSALAPASAVERVALVIGNDAYPAVVDSATQRMREVKLENCVNDASAVRDMLRDQLGFPEAGIVYGENLSRTQIYQKLEAFRKAATDARMALVFYAGHGMESLDGRENFLIPVDADLAGAGESEALLRGTGVNLTEVLSYVTKATSGPKVVLLDCCRDRPAKRTLTGAAPEGGGLAQIPEDELPADTLILLAAAPNKQASDGRGHGPFTRALLTHLPKGGQNILDSFFLVSDAVQEATGKQQIPWLKFDGSGTIFRQNALVSRPISVEDAVTETGLGMSEAEIAMRDKKIAELEARLAAKEISQSGTSAVMALPTIPAPVVPLPVPAAAEAPTKAISANEESLARGAIGDVRSFNLGGGQKIVLKYVPGGEFVMGSPKGEAYSGPSNPDQVTVTLRSHYWMGETEVTQGQWAALMATSPSDQKATGENRVINGQVNGVGSTHPMYFVSWGDTQEFVEKLNANGGPAPGWKWSLPTEAQWERACRGGTQTAYSFGDDDGQLFKYGNFADKNSRMRWADTTQDDGYGDTTSPVKSFKANEYGLYDMHGNVWEWCLDVVDKNSMLPGGVDPLGVTGSLRVIRGGSWSTSNKRWDDTASSCRSAYRGMNSPGYRGSGLGVRLVAIPVDR